MPSPSPTPAAILTPRAALDRTLTSPWVRPAATATADPEQVLLAAARAGDGEAFAALARASRQRLLRIALRRTRSAADAEDAVQETLVKAWRALAGFREEARFSTWTTRILLNEVFQMQRRGDYRRLQYGENVRVAEAEALSSGRLHWPETPEDGLLRADAHATLYRAVARLPEALRQVLQLDLRGRHSSDQIAKRLSITVAAVKTRKLRARAELRKRMSAAAPHTDLRR